DSGYANWTYALSQGNSPPNTVATGPSSGGVDGLHNTYMDFTTPVVALGFDGIGIDGTGPVATVNVFEHGSFSASVTVNGAGDPNVPVHVDLSQFQAISRIEIVSITDAGGIAWDDFVFALPDAAWTNYGAGYPGTNGIPALVSEQDPVIGST